MKLFLTSSTITKNLVKSFEELSGKNIDGLRAIFIPDAAFGVRPKKDLDWVTEERQFLIDAYGWKIKDLVLRDIEVVDENEFADVDVLFVNGGFSGHLANEMRRVGLDELLPKLFKKNIVYVGSSAGSMVCSKTQNAAEFYIGEPEVGAKDIPGLELVDFELYPHFKENLRPEIERLWYEGKLYLLEDGEAITVEDKHISILGQERVIEK